MPPLLPPVRRPSVRHRPFCVPPKKNPHRFFAAGVLGLIALVVASAGLQALHVVERIGLSAFS